VPRLLITETVLRDAQQSLIQGRLRLQHVLPIAATLDSIGYEALDAWGGGTFAASIRLLQEDPWNRLIALKKAITRTPLQMLIRGQSLITSQQQPDDVVQAFIERAVELGIGVVRMFDPLNDLRNLEVPIESAKRAGARVIGALIYSTGPDNYQDRLVGWAGRLKELGCHVIGIEDVAGILGPDTARKLVKKLRESTGLPISIHTHSTTALAPITYFAAAEAGAASIDTALSAMAWGASQPATETMVASFRGTPHDTGLDLNLIGQATRYFDELHDAYAEFQDPIAFRNDIHALDHQLPAPVLADLIRTLTERNAIDRYERLLEELVLVRQETGFPPLAAPVNQVIARQALLNTLDEKRYQHIEQPFRDYIKGLHGTPPGSIDPEVKRRALGSSEPITCRPADLLEPALSRAGKEMRRLGLSAATPEQVLTYVLFPEDAPAILRPQPRVTEPAPALARAPETEPPPMPASAPAAAPVQADTGVTREFTVEVDGESYRVRVKGDSLAPRPAMEAAATSPAPAGPSVAGDGAIHAPMQGMVVKVKVSPGDRVKLGDVVVVLEAMKMQNDIVATVSGTVREVFAKEGVIVSPNEVLMTVG
jgi:pyruvate carboxylase subunit B